MTYCLKAEKAVMSPDSLLGWGGTVPTAGSLGQMWHGKMQEDSPLSILIQSRGKIRE